MATQTDRVCEMIDDGKKEMKCERKGERIIAKLRRKFAFIVVNHGQVHAAAVIEVTQGSEQMNVLSWPDAMYRAYIAHHSKRSEFTSSNSTFYF